MKKRKQLFGGFFFLTLGLLAVLDQYSSININLELLWDAWPLILIIIGLAVIFTGKITRTVFEILLGILLGAMVYSFFSNNIFSSDNKNDLPDDWGEESRIYENYKYDYEFAELNLNAGASKITIDGITNKLWECFFNGDKDLIDYYTDSKENRATTNIELNGKYWNFWKKGENNLKISLNPNPIWSFNFEIGAATANLHLENYKVENIELDAGATNTKIFLGDKFPLIKIKAKIGAANLSVFIPQNSGCKVEVETIMVNKKFPNFIYKGDGKYVSRNFDESKNKVLISLEGGLANFKVDFY